MGKTNYKTPVVMDVFETLGIGELSIPEGLDDSSSDLETANTLKASSHQALDEGLLKDINVRIDKAVAGFEYGKHNREYVEKLYTDKINIYFDLAMQAHPLSEEGRVYLSEAVKCRKEFEALVGPMVTTVTEKNVNMFETVLTPDLKEDISVGKTSAIGAFRSAFESVYGVGTLVYHIDREADQNGTVLCIDWLYVDSMFHREGVSGFLIGELMNRAAEVGIKKVLISFPASNRQKLLLGYLLGKWHFKIYSGLNPEIVIRVADITEVDKIEALSKDVSAVSDLDKNTRLQTIQRSLSRFGNHGLPHVSRLPADYFDLKLSGHIGTTKDPKALVLVHKMNNGMYRTEYCGTEDGNEKYAAMLYAYVLRAAMSYDNNPIVMISCSSKMSLFLGKLCPNQMGLRLVTGVLDSKQ